MEFFSIFRILMISLNFRGDTTMITSVCAGIHIGAWTNFNLGNMNPYPYPPPYKILWPNYYMLG